MLRACSFAVLLMAAALPATAAPAATSCSDSNAIAQLTAVEGQVSIKPAGKVVKKSPGKLPGPLCAGDEVHTFAGKALVKSVGGDSVTLADNSVLAVKSRTQVALGKGQALFEIQKRGSAAPLQVATRLSVIGVKGTAFLVSDRTSGVEVALDSGVIDVASTRGKLAHYRETPAAAPKESSFEDYKRAASAGVTAEKEAFAQYKERTLREFVAYVANIELNAGKELAINGREAVERPTGAGSQRDIDGLRGWQAAR